MHSVEAAAKPIQAPFTGRVPFPRLSSLSASTRSSAAGRCAVVLSICGLVVSLCADTFAEVSRSVSDEPAAVPVES